MPDTHAHSSAPFSVLLVEDSDSDAWIMRQLIKEAWPSGNARVEEVSRLSEAFARVKNKTFDYILLDVNLPDLNGSIVISALHDEVPQTPIVVYSGVADEKFQARARDCGAADYVVKGYESVEVLLRVFNKSATLHPA
jgi:DNA-binding response OmpR family regulator